MVYENPRRRGVNRKDLAAYKREVVNTLVQGTAGLGGSLPLSKSRATRIVGQYNLAHNMRRTIGPTETAHNIATHFKLCENPLTSGQAGMLGLVAVLGLGAAAYFAYQDSQDKKKLKAAGLIP